MEDKITKTRPHWAALGGAVVLTIALPIAIDQGYFRYNSYVLPLLGIFAAVLYAGFLISHPRIFGWLRAHKRVFSGVIVFVGACLVVGFLLALSKSKAHISALEQHERTTPDQPAPNKKPNTVDQNVPETNELESKHPERISRTTPREKGPTKRTPKIYSTLPAAPKPKIQSMMIEARLTCKPKTGANIAPGDFPVVLMEHRFTRLEGPAGTFTIPFQQIYRVRKQDDGLIVLTNRFILSGDSPLLGSYVEMLESFDKLIIEFKVGPTAEELEKATFLQVLIKVNGEDYWFLSARLPNEINSLPNPEFIIPTSEFKREHYVTQRTSSSSVSPLRIPMERQEALLRSWISQTTRRTGANEMWLSQIFQSLLDSIPGGPDVDVPAALKQLAANGEVEILETVPRPYLTWWREIFQEDIRFKIKSLHNE